MAVILSDGDNLQVPALTADELAWAKKLDALLAKMPKRLKLIEVDDTLALVDAEGATQADEGGFGAVRDAGAVLADPDGRREIEDFRHDKLNRKTTLPPERPEPAGSRIFLNNMKQKIAFLATLALAGSAFASSTTSFDMARAGACKGDSIVAVQMAQEAQRRNVPVETLVNETHKNPPVFRVKLATVASQAIAHKLPEGGRPRGAGEFRGRCVLPSGHGTGWDSVGAVDAGKPPSFVAALPVQRCGHLSTPTGTATFDRKTGRAMQSYTLKMIALCAASSLAWLLRMLDHEKRSRFALVGFATLLPFLDGVRALFKLARMDRL